VDDVHKTKKKLLVKGEGGRSARNWQKNWAVHPNAGDFSGRIIINIQQSPLRPSPSLHPLAAPDC
jgi:hypothetical protein